MPVRVPPQCRSSALIVVLLLIDSFLPLWAAYHHHHKFLNDDTYITLAYAKSLANGRGFVFNHPPPTLGTTTPLHALVVAGLSIAVPFAATATIAVFFTAICWIAIVWTLFLFRRGWGITEWQVVILGSVVIASGWVGLLGMEAYLFAFLLVLCVSLFYSARWLFSGIAAGLLFLTRGEGVLLLPILIAYSVVDWTKETRSGFQTIRPAVYLAVGFSLPVLTWFIYAYSTFGGFLPNTLSAKIAQGRTGLWQSFAQRLVREWMPMWGRPFTLHMFPFLNLWWLLVVLGLGSALMKKRKWLIFLIWTVMYISAYSLLGVAAYWWYQFPVVFVLQLLAALGLIRCVEVLSSHSRFQVIGRVVSVGLVAFVVLLLGKPRVDIVLNDPGDPRGESYTELCDWIRANTQPSESIAYMEIGYLGYCVDNHVVDLAGLTMPDIVPHIAEGDFAWGFWHYSPDYYIYLPDFDWALAGIRADPRFAQQYQPVATLPGPRETDFTIYRRVQTKGRAW